MTWSDSWNEKLGPGSLSAFAWNRWEVGRMDWKWQEFLFFFVLEIFDLCLECDRPNKLQNPQAKRHCKLTERKMLSASRNKRGNMWKLLIIATTLGVATKLATTLEPLSLERASVLSCLWGGQKLGQALAARQLAESRLKSIEAVSQQLEAPVNHSQKRRLSTVFCNLSVTMLHTWKWLQWVPFMDAS